MQRLGYSFRDVRLLRQALTHTSYENEHPGEPSYERMEFLGDAILGFLVSEMLYRRYPDLHEGALTACKSRIVGGANLAGVGRSLRLAEHVVLGHGERREVGVQPSILADVVEALLAAVYLDGGLDEARAIARRCFADAVEDMQSGPPLDVKSELQSRVLSATGRLPRYVLVEESGPDHAKSFVFEVKEPGGVGATGRGPSKKAAQQDAAAALLALLDARES